MPFKRVNLLALPLLAAIMLPTGAAQAQEEASFPKITGAATFVSDYRFRGISFSDLDPAVQATIHLTTAPGFFFGAWGSSIAEFNGATTEIDVYGGWSGAFGPATATVGVYAYLYPGGTGTNVVELYTMLSAPLGPVTLTGGLNWAPDQKNLSRSSRYAFGTISAGIPGTPITLKGTVGNERGALVVDESGESTSKWDWLVGADLTFAPLTLGIAYVGNDLSRDSIGIGAESFRANRLAKDGFVLSITAAF